MVIPRVDGTDFSSTIAVPNVVQRYRGYTFTVFDVNDRHSSLS